VIAGKINENTYTVTLYDWDGRHDDYIAGHLRRCGDTEDSDEQYWRFYPNNGLAPICAGDLKRLSDFMADLNRNL